MRMIDADALERHVYTEWVNGELSNSEWVDFRQWLKDEPTVEAASPWHRVEEEMPDEVGSYLVYAPTYIGGSSSAKECKAGVMFARWLKGGHWSIEVGYYKRPGCVTHWMPIEPPKEDV